jgi:UDP-N-acetylglucosamine 2-epimerase (non-hydrolysing)
MAKKTVVTITGIRPDFIRMSFVFKKLDIHFEHILIHTGQHYDTLLSDVFFDDLGIRTPDYVLETGQKSSNHFEQLAYLSVAIPELFQKNNINPDLILFLGDSNSAGVSFPLKKAGYKIGHIEAGMRSYDKRMLEEINRTVCDHCSDLLFVYHDDYFKQLALENIHKNVHVVGNTIVEPLQLFRDQIVTALKRNDMILMDVHRPENFLYKDRLENLFLFANQCIQKYGIPVKLLYFKRLDDAIKNFELSLGDITMIPLLPYKDYLDTVYNSKFIISDSGTGQEEPALLGCPVVVPRDYTERPQSYQYNCSTQLKLDECNFDEVHDWLKDVFEGNRIMSVDWLGDGTTSEVIIQGIHEFFEK